MYDFSRLTGTARLLCVPTYLSEYTIERLKILLCVYMKRKHLNFVELCKYASMYLDEVTHWME